MNAPTITHPERVTASGRRGSGASRSIGKGIALPQRRRAAKAAATRKLTGNRCQCPTCGEYFNGVQPFDKHRVGHYANTGQRNTRRCLAVAEMEARGWTRNAAGFWTTEARAQRAARHRAGGVLGPGSIDPLQHHCPAPALPGMHAASVTVSEPTP